MFRHANRANAWPAAAMRNGKRFVQVQMANVRADVRRTAQADLCIEVRAVHINLSAVGVDDFANLLDRLLKHAVRRGIGDHQAGEVFFMRFSLGAQIGHVNVAVLVAGDSDDFQPGHDGAGGIRAVRGGRNETDNAVRFTPAFVISADDELAGVFALGTGIGLQ